MTPEQTLIAAARKLRETATEATRNATAPWHAKPVWPDLPIAGDRAHTLRAADQTVIISAPSRSGGPVLRAPIARHVALMHPGVGLALADWLEDAAAADDYGEHNPYALAVARAILGENQP